MRISPVQTYSFMANPHKRYKLKRKIALQEGQIVHNGQIFNRHASYYFREDMDWDKFGKYLKNKFSSSPKVNTLIWGCSRGEEAYTMAVILKRYIDDFKKFMPIEAMDIDKTIINKDIKYQKSGFLLDSNQIKRICDILGYTSCFDTSLIEKYVARSGPYAYKFRNDIIDSVNFSQSNILENVDKIDPATPTIVMCRNMWPYIDYRKHYEYAGKLYDRLNPNSIVVVGSYDWEGEKGVPFSGYFPEVLINNNFKTVEGMINQKRNPVPSNSKATLVFEK